MSEYITHDKEGILLSPAEFAEANGLTEFDLRPYVELMARDHQNLTTFVQHIAHVLNTLTQSLNETFADKDEEKRCAAEAEAEASEVDAHAND